MLKVKRKILLVLLCLVTVAVPACAPFPQSSMPSVTSAAGVARLQHPLGYYLLKPDEFVALLPSTWDAGEVRDLPGCPNDLCSGPGGNPVPMQIHAAERMNQFNPRTDAGIHGAVVARIDNRGGRPARRFRTAGNTSSYMIVYPPGPGTGGWQSAWVLVDVRVRSAGTSLAVVSSGEFRPCDEHETHTESYKARFGGCSGQLPPPQSRGPGNVRDIADPSLLALTQGGGDGWIECSNGCCEMRVTAQ